MQALSTATSDHCPLHLSLEDHLQQHRRFCFELFWTKLEGFDEAVREAWICDPAITDPFPSLGCVAAQCGSVSHCMGTKESWKREAADRDRQLGYTADLQLDKALDHRLLTAGERWLHNTLKLTSLGLASLERTIARQRSRIRWLGERDANTKLFHLVANGRKLRNFIPALHCGDSIITEQEGKEEAFYEAYKELLGTYRTRDQTMDMEFLGIAPLDLHELDNIFT